MIALPVETRAVLRHLRKLSEEVEDVTVFHCGHFEHCLWRQCRNGFVDLGGWPVRQSYVQNIGPVMLV
jgi:hypothetical protein